MRPPKWYKGRCYPALAPTPSILDNWKYDHNELLYVMEFRRQILHRLDPQAVWDDLGENAVLCCFEPGPVFNDQDVMIQPGVFCHRHLVADWFYDTLGKILTEVPRKYRPPPLTPEQLAQKQRQEREMIREVIQSLPPKIKMSPRL